MNTLTVNKNKMMLAGLTLICCLSACSRTDNSEKASIEAWNTVKTINRHWAVTENMDSLALFLHNDMVMIHPEAKYRLQGKNNIVESYKGYVNYAQTISLKELNPLVQLYNGNKTAVVTYYYDLEIKIPSGEVQRFTGRDMYTLIYANDKWIAVAQQFSPMPE